MPRVRPLTPVSRSDVEQDALLTWLRVGLARTNMRRVDLCKLTGITEGTMKNRFRNPGSMKLSELWKIEEVLGDFQRGEGEK